MDLTMIKKALLCVMSLIYIVLAFSGTVSCDTTTSVHRDDIASQDPFATTTRGFFSDFFSGFQWRPSRPRPRPRPRPRTPSSPPRFIVDGCVTTSHELVDSLQVIKARVDGTGVIKLCRSTLDNPLVLDQNVTLSGDDYTSVTIGCEGRKSTSRKSPKCAISRTTPAGIFEVGDGSIGGTGSEISFQLENLNVTDTIAHTPFIEANISGNSTLSILNSDFKSVQGLRALISVLLTGNTLLGIANSLFDSGDLSVGVLDTLPSSAIGSIDIDRTTFTNNDNGSVEGAVRIQNVTSDITITDSLFSNNVAATGVLPTDLLGGMYVLILHVHARMSV